MPNVFVRFLVDRTVNDAERKHYKAGETHCFSPASAEHWISRGVAVVVDPPAEEPAVVQPAPVAEKTPEPVAVAETLPPESSAVALKVDESLPPKSQLVAEHRPKRSKPDALKSTDIKKTQSNTGQPEKG
jgi:hypothetical protein